MRFGLRGFTVRFAFRDLRTALRLAARGLVAMRLGARGLVAALEALGALGLAARRAFRAARRVVRLAARLLAERGLVALRATVLAAILICYLVLSRVLSRKFF